MTERDIKGNITVFHGLLRRTMTASGAGEDEHVAAEAGLKLLESFLVDLNRIASALEHMAKS